MKITKKQLRQIIREERARLITERGNPALAEIEDILRRNLVEYIDTYMMSLSMNPSDPADQRRVRDRVDDIVTTIIR